MGKSLNINVSKFLENMSKEDFEKEYASKVLVKMLTEGLHTDITLKVEGSSVKAHRCVLAGTSSVFHAMFKHGMKEQITSTVEIADMSMEGLQLFLVLLYASIETYFHVSGFDAEIKKHLPELFRATYKYRVANTGVWKYTLAPFLHGVLTFDNCWEYCNITLSDLSITEYEELFERNIQYPRRTCTSFAARPGDICFRYILDNFDEVVDSNSTEEEMKRDHKFVWTMMKMAKRSRLSNRERDD